MFNDEGKRSHFQLEITELSKDGFKRIATWDPENQVSYTRTQGELEDQVTEALQNKTFIVVSRIGEPFLGFRWVQTKVSSVVVGKNHNDHFSSWRKAFNLFPSPTHTHTHAHILIIELLIKKESLPPTFLIYSFECLSMFFNKFKKKLFVFLISS